MRLQTDRVQKIVRKAGKWLAYYARNPRETLWPRVDVVTTTAQNIKMLCSHEFYIERTVMDRGYFEKESTEAVLEYVKPNDVVFDIGANVGYYTLLMLKLVGSGGAVHAFEPTAFAFERLLRNVQLNPDLPTGAAKLNRLGLLAQEARDTRAIESRFSARTLAFSHAEEISFTTVDHYCEVEAVDRINFIKIDVDGYDLQAMRGASAVLRRFHPALLCEMNTFALRQQGADIRDYVALLESTGYSYCKLLETPSVSCRLADFLGRFQAIDTISTNVLITTERFE